MDVTNDSELPSPVKHKGPSFLVLYDVFLKFSLKNKQTICSKICIPIFEMSSVGDRHFNLLAYSFPVLISLASFTYKKCQDN